MLPFHHLTETRLRVMIPSEEAIRDAKRVICQSQVLSMLSIDHETIAEHG